ncbi:MAG: hypothetical protein K6T65_05350 [Peptococcaceae bacterium]|nr:hypothetical protein [Peptococcaceae bacterium]
MTKLYRRDETMPQGSYLLFQKAEGTLLEEKSEKLFGIARVLDNYVQGTFDDLLKKHAVKVSAGAKTARQKKLLALNKILAPFTDMVAESFPGVGVGYYSADLDAILTYGPSRIYSDKVGLTVDPGHIGRQSMANQKEIVAVGSMVRGEIMNCARPLIREGRPIGFVWANETVEDIYRQIEQGARKLFFSSDIEPVLGLTGMLMLTSRQMLKGGFNESTFSSPVKYMDRYINLFLNSLKLGIFVLDAAGKVVFINGEAGRMLNLTAGSDGSLAAGEGRPGYRSFFAKYDLDKLSEIIDEFLSKNSEQKFFQKKHVFLCPAGEGDGPGERELDLIVTSIRDDTGVGSKSAQHIGTVVLFEDAARAREEEKRVQLANKLATLGEVAASLAHEIRNPLAIVLGSLQILPRRMDDRDFLYSFLRVATQELARVNNSIESLLDFARLSQPQFSSVDINNLLEETLRFFEVALENQKVAVRKDLNPLPFIEADEKQVRQALMNIILNALQAMPDGGNLLVATHYQQGDRFIRLMIADTGCGIRPEDQTYVFDAFFTTKNKGTGLGLTLVHRVADEHGGIIEFKSEPDKGTTFYLHLPVKQFTLNP